MQVSSEVLSVLSAARVEGESLFLVGQLDRKLYEQTNKVLEAAGGKWNRKARAHVFEAPAADRVDQIILSGSVDVPKDEFNFFPTPAALVQELLELAEISPGMRANFAALAGDVRLGVVRHMDFLAQEQEASFDRVVMNPPFAKQADIKHVTHALGFLRQGGRLVAVMSAGVVFRSDSRTTAFRDLVEARGGSIQPNPAGSFKESGTLVNTVTVVIPA
jgi:hypothetical protein